MNTGEHDERALALALEALLGRAEERARAGSELAARPEGRALRAEVAAELARSADELRRATRWSEKREARWRAELFARTTRRDLSWRGDLALLWDFLRQRLRASPALRVVAASLALHVIAAPAVAYWILREPRPEKRVTLRVELPAAEPFLPEPPPPALTDDELLRLARAQEARENERARERFVLAQAAAQVPALEAEPGAAPATMLLARRALALRASQPAEEAQDWRALDPLALALWLELGLDQHVRHGATPPELGLACARAEHEARGLADSRPGTAELLRAACARASRLGLLAGGPAGPELLGAPWFAALERAGREHDLAASPVWRAWLAWSAKQPR
ncbi:MAG TPA: hypothetical protein VF530_04300 [Planctomycetota bacterium]